MALKIKDTELAFLRLLTIGKSVEEAKRETGMTDYDITWLEIRMKAEINHRNEIHLEEAKQKAWMERHPSETITRTKPKTR